MKIAYLIFVFEILKNSLGNSFRSNTPLSGSKRPSHGGHHLLGISRGATTPVARYKRVLISYMAKLLY